MTDAWIAVVCAESGAVWNRDVDEPGCADPTHDHLQFEVHRHRTVVAMPDGTTVTAVSFDDRDPYARDSPPDFGLYLDDRWQPPWPHEILDWPDFGVPDDAEAVVAALAALRERARQGQQVEIGCMGGHGRTGTALAGLAVLCGHPPDRAVEWVRASYCDQAVETEEQDAFVRSLRS